MRKSGKLLYFSAKKVRKKSGKNNFTSVGTLYAASVMPLRGLKQEIRGDLLKKIIGGTFDLGRA